MSTIGCGIAIWIACVGVDSEVVRRGCSNVDVDGFGARVAEVVVEVTSGLTTRCQMKIQVLSCWKMMLVMPGWITRLMVSWGRPMVLTPRAWAVRTFHISCEEHSGIVCVWPWKRLARRTTSDVREGGSCSCCCRGCSSTDHQEVATFHVTKLHERFNAFGLGQWASLIRQAIESTEIVAIAQRRGQRQRGDDVGKRVERAESFVMMVRYRQVDRLWRER